MEPHGIRKDGTNETLVPGFMRRSQVPMDLGRFELRSTMPAPVTWIFDCRNIRAFSRNWGQFGDLQRNRRGASPASSVQQSRTSMRLVEVYSTKEYRMGLDLSSYDSRLERTS